MIRMQLQNNTSQPLILQATPIQTAAQPQIIQVHSSFVVYLLILFFVYVLGCTTKCNDTECLYHAKQWKCRK